MKLQASAFLVKNSPLKEFFAMVHMKAENRKIIVCFITMALLFILVYLMRIKRAIKDPISGDSFNYNIVV
jgi:hypothetical protein